MRELLIENYTIIDVIFFCFSNRLFYGTYCLHRCGISWESSEDLGEGLIRAVQRQP